MSENENKEKESVIEDKEEKDPEVVSPVKEVPEGDFSGDDQSPEDLKKHPDSEGTEKSGDKEGDLILKKDNEDSKKTFPPEGDETSDRLDPKGDENKDPVPDKKASEEPTNESTSKKDPVDEPKKKGKFDHLPPIPKDHIRLELMQANLETSDHHIYPFYSIADAWKQTPLNKPIPIVRKNDNNNSYDTYTIYKDREFHYDPKSGLLYADVPKKVRDMAPTYNAVVSVFVEKSHDKALPGPVREGSMGKTIRYIDQFRLIEIRLLSKEQSTFPGLSSTLD